VGGFFLGGKDDLMILQGKMTTSMGETWMLVDETWQFGSCGFNVYLSLDVVPRASGKIPHFFDRYCSDGWLNHDVVDILL